jgi:hypothetical protein
MRLTGTRICADRREFPFAPARNRQKMQIACEMAHRNVGHR